MQNHIMYEISRKIQEFTTNIPRVLPLIDSIWSFTGINTILQKFSTKEVQFSQSCLTYDSSILV